MATTLLNSNLPANVVKQLPAFFNSYPTLKSLTPASWIMWSDDKTGPELKVWLNKACHWNLIYTEGYDHLITAVPKKDKLSLAYLHMIINGPFKSFSDLIALEKCPKGTEEYYIRCSNLDKWPANVLYNFCIATRFPIEYHEVLHAWGGLVKEGYNRPLAFLLAVSVKGDIFRGSREFPPSNHLWVDYTSSWSNVINGKLHKLSDNYKANPGQCKPCNVIWSDDGKEFNAFTYASDEEISKYLNLSVGPPPEEAPLEKLVKAPKKKAPGQLMWDPPAGWNAPPPPLAAGGAQWMAHQLNAMPVGEPIILNPVAEFWQHQEAVLMAAQQPPQPAPVFVENEGFEDDDDFDDEDWNLPDDEDIDDE